MNDNILFILQCLCFNWLLFCYLSIQIYQTFLLNINHVVYVIVLFPSNHGMPQIDIIHTKTKESLKRSNRLVEIVG